MDFKSLKKLVLVESSEEMLAKPTKEMFDNFYFINNTHKNNVQKNINVMIGRLNLSKNISDKLILLGEEHDESKNQPPELIPYVWLGWYCRLLTDCDKQISDATKHHIITNKHHPEAWVENKNTIGMNPKNRNRLIDAVDVSLMPEIYMLEMLCDWKSIADKSSNTTKEWFDRNNQVRWKFSDKQVEFIKSVLNKLNW